MIQLVAEKQEIYVEYAVLLVKLRFFGRFFSGQSFIFCKNTEIL